MRLLGHKLNKGAVIGFAIIAINVFAAIFARVISPHGEAELIGDVWAPPSADAWLGLDNLGRDMLSRILYGAQTTISIALVTTMLSFAIGITLGFTAAVVGKWVDMVLVRIVDTMMAIPSLIFSLLILSVLGTSIRSSSAPSPPLIRPASSA